MSDNSKIEWCDASWNPIKSRVRSDAPEIARTKGYTSLIQIAEKNIGKVGWHCEHASMGCDHCYAESINHRCLPECGTGLPYDRRSRDLVEIFLDEAELLKPLSWKKPRRIFVESMSDWCATFVTDEMRDRIMAVAALCPQHTFLFLTKRAERCAKYFDKIDSGCYVGLSSAWCNHRPMPNQRLSLPLPNVHLGFSAENQECFDERWGHMRKLAAGGWKLWVSLEPLLSSVDIAQSLRSGGETYGRLRESAQPAESREEQKGSIYFAVIGGESGHGARPCNIDCIRSIVRQCQDAGVAVFVKQLGAKPQRHMGINGALDLERFAGTPIDRLYDIKLKNRKGADMAEWPEDLRIREVPR